MNVTNLQNIFCLKLINFKISFGKKKKIPLKINDALREISRIP